MLRLQRLSYIDFNKIDNLAQIILIALGSYVLGHIFNGFTYRYWYLIFIRKRISEVALTNLKLRYPIIDIRFGPNDVNLLFARIRQNDLNLSQFIERHRAEEIMLRNISLGLFLFSLVQFIQFIRNSDFPQYFELGLGAIIMSFLALRRAGKHAEWFHRDIFLQSLNYGSSLREIFTNLEWKSEDIINSIDSIDAITDKGKNKIGELLESNEMGSQKINKQDLS
ncbi:MAG TPA: hypothetical protein VJ327_09625 [Patescibacteria group bacterium]|nr:hypothetical protein [Patescibacteria group bacterium]